MKTLKCLAAIALLTVSGVALADSTIVTETKTWRSVPITVDTTKNTYVVTDTTFVPEGKYYYTYSGYRCVTEKNELFGVNVLVFKASVASGTDIYCYPE